MPVYSLGGDSGEEILIDGGSRFVPKGSGALVYSPSLPRPVPLSQWVTTRSNTITDGTPDADYVVLVPYQDRIIEEDLLSMVSLSLAWDVPGVVMRHLVSSAQDHGTYGTRNGSSWRSWTIHVSLHPDLLFHNLAVSSSGSSLKAIAFVPRKTFETAEEIVRSYVTESNTPASPELRSLGLQTLFIWLGYSSWKQHHSKFSNATQMLIGSLQGAMKDVSTSPAMSNVDYLLNTCFPAAMYMQILRNHARQVVAVVEKLPDGDTAHNEFKRYVLELACNAECALDAVYTNTHAAILLLKNSLRTYSATIQINSMNYVRENLIAMRRIAQSNEAQGAELYNYAKESREDARDMKRLAFLTMVFLPSTAVATIFSMPFLALDDKLQFNAVGKLWIFLAVSIVFTTLTFLASAAWDRASSAKEKAAEESKVAESTEAPDHDPDQNVLEPDPYAAQRRKVMEDTLLKLARERAAEMDAPSTKETVDGQSEAGQESTT